MRILGDGQHSVLCQPAVMFVLMDKWLLQPPVLPKLLRFCTMSRALIDQSKSSENGTQNKPLACHSRSGHHPSQMHRRMGQRVLYLRRS